LKYPDAEEWEILGWMLKQRNKNMLTGFSWLMRLASGGLLFERKWNHGLYEWRGYFW